MKYDVCVFGGCSVDYMFYQDKEKNYPKVPDMMVTGGKGSNQAVASSRAGDKTNIITKIGVTVFNYICYSIYIICTNVL